MNEVKREIRRILLGYISFSDQVIVAAPKHRLRLLGIFGGATGARLFGVASRTRRYRLGESKAAPDELCGNAFANLGRRIRLESVPEKHAVFYAPYWYNPSVLTAECLQSGEIEVIAHTAFTLTAWLNTAHALRRFEKFMPETLERQGAPKKQPEKKEKPAKEPLAERMKRRFSRRDED